MRASLDSAVDFGMKLFGTKITRLCPSWELYNSSFAKPSIFFPSVSVFGARKRHSRGVRWSLVFAPRARPPAPGVRTRAVLVCRTDRVLRG
jgi:hypothetical protein